MRLSYAGPMAASGGAGSLLSLFWTPIIAIGSSDGSRPNAQISVSTFGASTVPDRPRILCVLYKFNLTHDLVLERGSFSASVLAEEQADLIPRLGFVSGREQDKLAGVDFQLTSRGNPVLEGCLGWMECLVIDSSDWGDATAFLAAVDDIQRLREGAPLVWSRIAPSLPPEWRETWSAKQARDTERYRSMMRWLE